jgi:hypothetical protein
MMEYMSEKIKEIVNEHIKMIELRLPNFLESYYIFGSVVLGAFDYGKSDLDFIVVVVRKVTETDLNILKKIHVEMQKKFHKTILDGMYLLKDDIDSLNKSEISCLRFNEGEFKGFRMFDRNSVDAFELKKYGITVRGQEIESLKYSVDFDILIGKMRENLNTYWLKWANAYRRFPSIKYIALFISPKVIEWGVLGVSRLYYTFKEKGITSKVGAGEYALQTVPQKWHKIINEAMRLRKDAKKSYYNSIFERRKDALGYIDYIIQESNGLFEKKSSSPSL